jgi:hypothetical protein
MESKQPHNLQEHSTCTPKTPEGFSDQLADIELKLDHIIASLNDSIHHLRLRESGRESH